VVVNTVPDDTGPDDTGPDDTELARLLTQLLRVVSPGEARNGHTAASSAAAGAAAPTGLPQPSESEARALIELVKARGIAQGELGSLLGLEKSTVSRLAASLERKGWLRRGRDEGNQRYVRLYLTPEGAAVADRLWDAWHSRQTRILAALSDEERDGLSRGLRGLVRGLAAEGLLADAGRDPAQGAGRDPVQDTGRYTEAPSAR
jgi:DNA-binding MarR family transcriptional regulator